MKEVAAAVGISPQHLSRIEVGSRDPSLKLLRKLGKELGVRSIDLAGEDTDLAVAGAE